MQKKILAAVAAALCGVTGSAMAQQAGGSKVELWGIVDAAVRHTNNEGAEKKSLTKMIGGGMSQSRFGINVEEDLGNGSKALVVLENRFTTDDGNTTPVTPSFFQLAHVGLQTPYGRLTMGRQYNVLFDVVTSTYASFPYSPYMDAYKPELGMAVTARSSNALKYLIANSDRSLVAGLQYSFAEGNKAKNLSNGAVATASQAAAAAQQTLAGIATQAGGGLAGQQAVGRFLQGLGLTPEQFVGGSALQAVQTYAGDNEDALKSMAGGALKQVGGYLRYAKNGLALGGGYLRTDLPAGSKLDAWTLGGSYRAGKAYFNLGYGLNKVKYEKFGDDLEGQVRAQVRDAIDGGLLNAMWQGQTNGGFQAGDANKRTMYKVGFGYQITPQINAGLHYYHAKQSGSVSGDSNGKAHFMVAAVDYAFSKRTDAYFAIDHTKVSGGDNMYLDASSQATKRTGFTVGLRHRF